LKARVTLFSSKHELSIANRTKAILQTEHQM
jgi:hypothetical protein